MIPVVSYPKPADATPKWILEYSKYLVPIQTLEPTEYTIPQKQIKDASDIPQWLDSPAFTRIMTFLVHLNESVKNVKNHKVETSENVQRVVDLIEEFDVMVTKCPPLENADLRFGNPAYRDWYAMMNASIDGLLTQMLPSSLHPAIPELRSYLADSFGNSTRIDYGSGHEFSFLAFLCALRLLGFTEDSDCEALVLSVFAIYLKLCRRLQTVYRLEPAGSHGVWGIDDFHFVPFVLGSSQLLDHKHIKPKSFLNEDVLEAYSKDYMFLDAIRHINQVKKGPFFEHSPILYDISGVPLWSKVNHGLIKMYVNEVLRKVPVVQHFAFGNILPFK